jgi:hypothetical protein
MEGISEGLVTLTTGETAFVGVEDNISTGSIVSSGKAISSSGTSITETGLVGLGSPTSGFKSNSMNNREI